MTRLAPTQLPSVVFAEIVLAPFFNPVTRPRIRPWAFCANAAVMSVPSRSTLRVAGNRNPGVFSSTSAEPPLIRSARLDSVVIVNPEVGGTLALSSSSQPATNKTTAAAKAAERGRKSFTIVVSWCPSVDATDPVRKGRRRNAPRPEELRRESPRRPSGLATKELAHDACSSPRFTFLDAIVLERSVIGRRT